MTRDYYVSTTTATGRVTVDGDVIVGTPPIWRRWRGWNFWRFLDHVRIAEVVELESEK